LAAGKSLINTGDIFKAVMTEEKLAKSERYRINGKHFHLRNYWPNFPFGCSL